MENENTVRIMTKHDFHFLSKEYLRAVAVAMAAVGEAAVADPKAVFLGTNCSPF